MTVVMSGYEDCKRKVLGEGMEMRGGLESWTIYLKMVGGLW